MEIELVTFGLRPQNPGECDPFALHGVPCIIAGLNADTHP